MKKEEKKSEYVYRPDLPQVRVYRDIKDGKWHRVRYNSKWTISEEVIEDEEDLFIHCK